MKKSMVDLYEGGYLDDDDVVGMPHLTVHDELDFSYEDSPRGIACMKEIKHVMENTVSLLVPLRVDIASGPNWGDVSDWPSS
jgi:DNA polymerase I-like protein with 3'-5' exonuclease and polymerase domains